ncbi:MAG: hypothetical protein ACRDRH_27120 [Pseudonocardia sp.]
MLTRRSGPDFHSPINAAPGGAPRGTVPGAAASAAWGVRPPAGPPRGTRLRVAAVLMLGLRFWVARLAILN